MTGAQIAQEDQRRLGSLKAELKRISGLIESGKARLDHMGVSTREIEKTELQLKDLAANRDTLRVSVRALERDTKIASRALSRIQADLKKKTEEYKRASEDCGIAADKLVSLRAQIKELSDEIRDMRISKREMIRIRSSEIAKDLAAATGELDGIRRQIVAGKREIRTIEVKRVKVRELDAAIAAKKKRSGELDVTISEKSRVLEQKSGQITAVDESIAKKRADHDAQVHTDRVQLALEKKDLEDREGKISFAKQNLIEKARLLRQAKSELESFHGKQLRHIVIAAEEDLS